LNINNVQEKLLIFYRMKTLTESVPSVPDICTFTVVYTGTLIFGL